jgi:hypothetical protein
MSVRGREDAKKSVSEAGRAEPGQEERRASGAQRVPFEALVAVGEGDKGGFEAESVDVSPDGMRLRTAYLPSEGDRLICRFDGMGSEIVVEGEVLWRHEEAKGGEFGLRFVGLDEATASAVRAMCMTLGDPGEEAQPAEDGAGVPRGSRVRLHIEGLGSPMKARVRESAARELQVGSNLEFLKVGRALELEDVDQGAKREAIIDDVKVDVDPATNVPQLVVTLRFDGAAGDNKRERAPVAPPTRRAVPAAAALAKEAAEPVASAEPDERAQGTAAAMLSRAASVGQVAASKIGPALAGVGLKAKGAATGALNGVLTLVQKRRAQAAEAKKAAAPRRTTAPPPGGALTSDGRRLVRDEGAVEEDEAAPPRSPRRAAATGAALGLVAVLVIFGAVRMLGRGRPATQAVTAQSAATALPAATAEAPTAATAPGTPTANVPLFGATPLSTTEPAPGAAPAPSASAVASAAAAPGANDDDDAAPGDDKGGTVLKEWGQGPVSHPVTLKIKMDGPIERITGASGAMGFTISIPGRRSVSAASDLARKDKRLASVNVVNTSHGAEVTVQFKDGVPPYLAKAKGNKLEIAIGKEKKVAKKKKSKHHKDD